MQADSRRHRRAALYRGKKIVLGQENSRLRALIVKHEGLRLKPYRDVMAKLTIGVGRNLEDVGITELEAMAMLSHDLERVAREAVENFPWFKNLNFARQDVVLSMLFNLGLPKFKTFKRMIGALQFGNFDKAADEMMNSRWASQVGVRAVELAAMMRAGQYSS